jgi:biopolymer transport protein ExbB
MRALLDQAIEIWASGGWAMIALALNALILFVIGFNLWFKLRGRGFRSVSDRKWRSWIAEPGKRRGAVGRLLDFVMGASDLKDLGVRFDELRATEVAPFTRDLRLMKRAVSTAPLLGLLGTVTGMLATFQALATGSGGQKTMDLVAGGISEALITTETGLMIALPGLVLQYHLTRERDRFDAFLARLETACAQYVCVWKQVRARGTDEASLPAAEGPEGAPAGAGS